MSAEFRRRVSAILAAHYGMSPDETARPGVTLCPVAAERWDDWLELMPVGARVGLEVPPALWERVAAVVAARPADHALTGADFAAAWGDLVRVGGGKVYMLDEATFRPFVPTARCTVRPLTAADRAAFDAFAARCTPHERAEADVGLEQIAPCGVFDGARLVAAASVCDWLGMADVGVLTDPDYRGQGLGKAVVTAAAAQIHAQGGLLCYRHGLSNLGSQGVAKGLRLSLYATLEAVFPS